MAAMIRPSLILKMDMDERQYSDELVAEIKRSYSYVAPSLVSSHEAADGDGFPENVLRFVVKLHKPYWDKNDAAADEVWQGVMPKWLRNMFAKVSNTVVASNNVRAEEGRPCLPYAWLELEFGDDMLVALKTAADSSAPEGAVELVERVRELACSGAFGDGEVACVRVPSRASYEAQLAAVLELERAEAAEDAEGAQAAEPADAADGVAEDAAAQAAQAAQGSEGVADAQADQDADDAQAAEAEDAADQAIPEVPAFDVDLSVWGIEFADGTVREFDAAAGTLLA